MDDCGAPRHDDSISISVPGSEAYCELVSSTSEKAALLADMEPNAAARARLVAEEVFLHIIEQCRQVKRRDGCRMRFTILPEGLALCFYTAHLAFDPQNIPSYDLSEVLETEQTCSLGRHLVKSFAQRITLTRNGPERTLCLLMTPGVEDGSIRHWSRLVPSLNPGVTITRKEQGDQVVHCLNVPSTGKAYIASELARHVLGLVDGKTPFDRIMARTLSALPHFKPVQGGRPVRGYH